MSSSTATNSSNMPQFPSFGLFARLPLEIREQIWNCAGAGAATGASASLKREIFSTLNLTFEISGERFSKSTLRDKWASDWPTVIRVYDQHREYYPLHPAFLTLTSPEKLRFDNFRKTPLHEFKSLNILLPGPASLHYMSRENFARCCVALWWLLELFKNVSSHCLPVVNIRLEDPEINDTRYEDSWPGATPINRVIFFEHGNEKLYKMLRVLRMLRNVKVLRFYYPPLTEKHPRWKRILSMIQEVKRDATTSTAFDDLDTDRQLKHEIDDIYARIETNYGSANKYNMLRTEKQAFWCELYEQGARARLSGEEHEKFDKERLFTAMYNPLGRPLREIYEHVKCKYEGGYEPLVDRDQRRIRESLGLAHDVAWSPRAWFMKLSLQTPATSDAIHGDRNFREHLQRCSHLYSDDATPWN